MAEPEISAFVDGIVSIGTHNNVHRIVCYRLTSENQPEPTLELIIPTASIAGFIAALTRLSGGAQGSPESATGLKKGSGRT
ncbi:MAG: hypothetical protein ABSA49_12180 [Rhizomicrobium sp.]|jgi:hypothetical protein